MKRLLPVLLLVIAIVVPLSAQEEASGQQSIEELYLSQDLEIQILRSQALANDLELKQLALRDIRGLIEGGTLTSANDGVYIILESLATEGVARQVREGGAVINNFPQVRREAVELLGKVGGETARDTLIRILRDDPEPMVLAEAAYALGTIGMNQNNLVSDYLVSVLQQENASATPDNNLAYSIILSLEKLSAANEGLSDPEVIGTLLETAASPYIRSVRRRAVEAIVNMRSHGEE